MAHTDTTERVPTMTMLSDTAAVLRDTYGLRTDVNHGTGGGCTALLVHDAEGGVEGYHVLITDGNYGTDVETTEEIVGCVYVGPEDEGSLFLYIAQPSPIAPADLAAMIAQEI